MVQDSAKRKFSKIRLISNEQNELIISLLKKKKHFQKFLSSKYDMVCCHICHYQLETLTPFNLFLNLLNTEEAGRSNTNTRGAAEQQAN